MKRIRLCRQQRDGWSADTVYIDLFDVEDSVDNPEQALRDTVRYFFRTAQGKAAIKQTCEAFNWGDALQLIPDCYFEKHGLHPVHEDPLEIWVDQDEELCTGEEVDEEPLPNLFLYKTWKLNRPEGG